MELATAPRARSAITVGYSHREIIAAVKDYLARRGYDVKTGVTYVIGAENDQAGAEEPIVTLVIDKMPNMRRTYTSFESGAVARGNPSPRAGVGQQKFELSHQAVREALSAAYVKTSGNPLPNGPITLIGLRNNGTCGCTPALTLFVDPS